MITQSVSFPGWEWEPEAEGQSGQWDPGNGDTEFLSWKAKTGDVLLRDSEGSFPLNRFPKSGE